MGIWISREYHMGIRLDGGWKFRFEILPSSPQTLWSQATYPPFNGTSVYIGLLQ
jgi:hypothetical protein